jgi:hypothetical protein
MGREHLIPWKPGQSGNPGGIPREMRVIGPLRRFLDMEPDELFEFDEKGRIHCIVRARTTGEMVALRMIELAALHDGRIALEAIRQVVNYSDGPRLAREAKDAEQADKRQTRLEIHLHHVRRQIPPPDDEDGSADLQAEAS